MSDNKNKEQTEVDSALKIFKKEMEKYPLLMPEENAKLCIQAQMGNDNALNDVLNHNLRLVFSTCSKYFDKLNHLKPEDLLQEGCIALIEAVRNYDPERGAFSTCAVLYMEGHLKRVISNTEDEIRKPVNIKEVEFKYGKLLGKYAREGNKLPSDEEICEKLKISQDTLDYLKHKSDYVPVSMNTKLTDEEDANELEDFISYDKNDYNEVLSRIDNRKLFALIKSKLPPREYYIIYYRYLSDNLKTLEELGAKTNLTKERIRQIEVKSLKLIKPFLENNKSRFNSDMEPLNEKIDYYNILPITPDNIVLYLYVKNYLTDIEKQVLKLELFGEYKINYYLKSNEMLKRTYEEIRLTIKDKIEVCLRDIEKYKQYFKNIIRNYGTDIFLLNVDEEIDYINYDKIENIYSKSSYEEILSIINANGVDLDKNEINLLERYFKVPEAKNLQNSYIEQEIYLLNFGFKNKNVQVDEHKLYLTYKKNLEEFDEEQRLFLESFVFNKLPKKVFLEKYPNSIVHKQKTLLIEKLERLYFNVYEYLYGNFDKKKYIEVKKKYKRLLTPERIKLLDMYYGVNGKVYTIQEIADHENMDYIRMHDKLSSARKFCRSLYYNREGVLRNDFKIYVPYILDKNVDFKEETRNILKMFVIKKYTYDEISEETGLSKYKISNLITDAIRKIDFIRFGISTPKSFNINEINNLFSVKGDLFTEEEKEIIFMRYLKNISNDDISIIIKKDKDYVNKVVAKFNRIYRKYISSEIKLNINDIKNEINSHVSESVISDFQKVILSLYYGLRNKYNKDKKTLSIDGIINELNITKNVFWHQYQFAMEFIRLKKEGLHKNDLVYIERDKLDELLDDCHLPISDKEKEIICYLFELKGYPYKTIRELTEVYSDNESSIRRRYQRAILTIYKYLNNEIEGKISYEYDILPILKYFSKNDCILIEEYFLNDMTYEKISKKYKLPFDYVVDNITRIRENIYDLLNDKNAKKFDFEYYRNNKDNPQLPFYGNRELATVCFDMFFGEINMKRMSVPDIIKTLDIDNSLTSVNRLIIDFMISFCKLKSGIYKVKEISNENIYAFYDEKEMELLQYEKDAFLKYFSLLENSKKINSKRRKTNNMINYIILKYLNPEFFSLNNATREEVISILKKHRKEIIPSVYRNLMARFEITEKEFMNGKDKNHVIKILSKIEKADRKKEQELTLKRCLE